MSPNTFSSVLLVSRVLARPRADGSTTGRGPEAGCKPAILRRSSSSYSPYTLSSSLLGLRAFARPRADGSPTEIGPKCRFASLIATRASTLVLWAFGLPHRSPSPPSSALDKRRRRLRRRVRGPCWGLDSKCPKHGRAAYILLHRGRLGSLRPPAPAGRPPPPVLGTGPHHPTSGPGES